MLGEARSLKRPIEGVFIVTIEDLINIHHRIIQRVERQNRSVVSNFRCVIDFSDNVRRIIEGISAFEHLSESKAEKVMSISLEYTFLIHFPDKSFPEKQNIILRFETIARRLPNRHRSIELLSDDDSYPSFIYLEIYYTEITWGDDMDHLIAPYIRENYIMANDSNIIIKTFSVLKFLIGLLFGLYVLYFLWSMINFRDAAAIRQRTELLERLGHSASLEDKVDALLIDSSSVTPLAPDYFQIGAKFVAIIAMSIFFSLLFSELKQKSHIILNQRGKDRMEAEIRRNNFIYAAVVVAFVVSVAAGLIANYITKIIEHL